MGLFSKAVIADNVQEDKDIVGGGYKLLESGIYDATIKVAYATTTQKGGTNLVVEFDIDGHTHTETLFMMNERNETYYTTKDGEQKYYAGYSHANSLALFATGKKITDLKDEDKILELYDFNQGKKVPTKVPTVPALFGKTVKVAILKEIVAKKKQQGNEWVVTDETKEQNTLQKVMSAKDSRTVNEVTAKKDTAEFAEKWLEKYKGVTVDKTSKDKASSNTVQAQPVSSLFAS